MLRHDNQTVSDHLSRRDFLRAGAVTVGTAGLSLASFEAAPPRKDVNCILLFLVGGPSHLDTFDPKPSAPSDIRGPFRAIQTNQPGIRLSETLPRLASQADKVALVRSVHHDEAPIHETGHQLMQTGRLCRAGVEHPHFGAVVAHLRGERAPDVPPFVVFPNVIGNTGVNVSHGQSAGWLGPNDSPLSMHVNLKDRRSLVNSLEDLDNLFRQAGGSRLTVAKKAFNFSAENSTLQARYGTHEFGRSCLIARRLVETGVRFVTVNMFDSVFDRMTWDCHADGNGLATTLDDYRDTLCPMFDQAYSALIEDLAARGMLETTLVLAMGEFGRTPKINPRGGRDHWPGCWTVLFAGAGIQGGRVVGASDRTGSEPHDRPVKPADLTATIYHALGISPRTTLPGPDGSPLPLSDGTPLLELF